MVLNPERVTAPFTPALSTPALSVDRRAAALVALLALEGPLGRSRLAGLLWPEVPEQTARNNLSQTLRRLRQGGIYRLAGDAQLTLLTALDEAAALALLTGHDYDDLTDLADLLLTLRERRLVARLRSLWAELEKAEEAGEVQAALDLTAVLLDLDPLHEVTWRAAMRLHQLLGDRAGALAAYHRCKRLLHQELGLEPSQETLRLAREIETSPAHVLPAQAALPLSVRRPPRLIGRETAWREMEWAWAEGKGIVLSGEPGVGKTRLLRDFVAAHGQAAHFEGRPGDRLVPYSTHARTYAALLRQYPDLSLPAWVRRELARIVPALGDPPLPLASDADKLRFYQAKTETLRLAAASGMSVVAFDDLQYVDEASVEAGEHSLSVFWGSGAADGAAPIRTIHAYRSGELSAELEARIDALVSAGLAVRVRLSPLLPEEMDELLGSLDLPELAGRADGLTRASGGNPLLLLEGARHLLTGGEAQPLSGQMAAFLGQRLQRLSPAAMNLARVAAVLGPDLSPEAAGAMLGQDPIDLGGPWAELEAAQVLRGQTFIHDLLSEGVLSGLPAALSGLLHRRAGAALEPLRAAPARIAQHWEEGGEAARAASWWLRAASEAGGAYRQDEAVHLLRHAAALAESHGLRDAALDAYRALHELLVKLDPEGVLDAVHERFLALARTPAEQAEAWHLRAGRSARLGRGAEAEAAARSGLTQGGPPALQAALLDDLVEALWAQNRVAEALDTLYDLLPIAEALGEPGRLATVRANLAVVLDNFDRHSEALPHHREAVRQARLAGARLGEAQALINLAICQAESGQYGADAHLDDAAAVLDGAQGAEADYLRFLTQATRAIVLTELDRYAPALEALGLAEAALPAGASPTMTAALHRYAARLDLILGDPRAAEAHLDALDAIDDQHPQQRASGLLLRALMRLRQGRDALEVLDEAEALLGPQPRPISLGSLWLVRAEALLPRDPQAALGVAGAALTLAEAHPDLPHLGVAVRTRAAQAHLALGNVAQASLLIEAAVSALEHTYPADLEAAEVRLTRARVLSALGDPAAAEAWTRVRDQVLALAGAQVPKERREAFLHGNPVSSRVLAEHTATGGWTRLSDRHWALVAELLGGSGASTGRPRRDTRAVLDGVLWAIALGAPWNKPFPAHLPSAATCYRRYREWQQSGALAEVQRRLRAVSPGE